MQKIHVLVVDDEWNMRNLLKIYLTKNGFQVTEAVNGYEAIKLTEQTAFDLILLDIMMPDMDGWDVCKKMRETQQTPILMLTARTETKDKVRGFQLGADDYLVKPFDPEELIARCYALLRRVNGSVSVNTPALVISYQGIRIDPEGREIRIMETPIECTPKEFDLFRFLAEHPNRAFTREVLLEQVWGGDYIGDIRTVDTHIKNVREKARKAGLPYIPIQTVWGVGYKFQGIEAGE
jgi:two-component system response regulator ResD